MSLLKDIPYLSLSIMHRVCFIRFSKGSNSTLKIGSIKPIVNHVQTDISSRCQLFFWMPVVLDVGRSGCQSFWMSVDLIAANP